MRKPVRKRPLRSKKKEWEDKPIPAKARKPGQIEFLPLLLLLILPFGIFIGAIQQGWDEAHRPFFALNTQGEIKIEWHVGGFERVSYRKGHENKETLTVTNHFPLGGAHKQDWKNLSGLVGYPLQTTGNPECTWLSCFLGPNYLMRSNLIEEARERAKLTKETI